MNHKYSNIDDLFREKFKDFELFPPDHIWENVKQQINAGDSKTSGKSISKGGIIGVMVILILSTILTIFYLSSNADKLEKSNIENQTFKSINHSAPRSGNLVSNDAQDAIKSAEDSKAISGRSKNQDKLRFDLSSDGSIEKGKSDLKVNVKPSLASIFDIDAEEEGKTSAKQGASEQDQSHEPDNESPEALSMVSMKDQVNNENDNHSINLDKTVMENGGNLELKVFNSPEPEIRSDYGKRGNFAFGLFLAPEMIFYPSAIEFNTRSYTVDLNLIYRFSGYTVQSGPGISWSSDNGDYKVDYNQYLGSYDDVYNVTFDTTGGQYIPVFHTENVNVYDTIDHISITPTKRRFTYLNIPLLFGYENEGQRLGWFVKAGPNLSILLHENAPEINLADSQNKILNIESEIPARLKTNWQFVFSAGASYKISNTLSFTLEPLFKYYINSTHEQNSLSNRSPYSLGLRAGMVLGF